MLQNLPHFYPAYGYLSTAGESRSPHYPADPPLRVRSNSHSELVWLEELQIVLKGPGCDL
jgi:hypothetical protein